MVFKSVFLAVMPILLNDYMCLGTENENASTSSTSERISCLILQLKHPMMKGRELAAWGRQLMEMKEYKKALTCFDRAIEKNPYKGSYYGLRGLCLFEMGKVSAAASYIEDAVNIEINPEKKDKKPVLLNEIELATMGRIMCDQRKFTHSIWCFNEAIMKMGPNRASHYRQRGECYMKMGNIYFESALDDFRKVVRLERGPRHEEDIQHLSRASIELERYEDAIKEVSLIDDTGAELISLGDELRYNRKKLNEAWTCYNAAIDKNPENASYYQKRGLCYMSMKMYSRAVSDFRLSMDLDPHIENGAFYFTKALFYANERTEALRASTSLDHKYLEVLGNTFLADGKFQEGLDCFNEALDKQIKNSESAAYSYTKRGICNRKLGNLEAAISDFEESLRLKSDNKIAQINKCEVLLETSLDDAANEVIRELEENANKYMLTPTDINRIDIARQMIIEEANKKSQQDSTINDDILKHVSVSSESSPTVICHRDEPSEGIK